MMPLSRIFFKSVTIAALVPYLACAANVAGQLRIESPARRSRVLSDVVVWLDPLNSLPPSREPEHARLLQKGKMFTPHILVIRTGTVVDFPNEDPIFHNAFSTYDGQLFDIGLYPPGTSRSIRFRRPGVVRVFCNIHPSMAAVIVVVDTPYFTTASTTGQYRFTNIPEGTYRVNVYDERSTGGQRDGIPLEIEGTSGPEVKAPLIRLSEAGYVRGAHKNKYGLDYPPDSDNSAYDGITR
jgi:hypothetical protein